jgi:hypothetical protein
MGRLWLERAEAGDTDGVLARMPVTSSTGFAGTLWVTDELTRTGHLAQACLLRPRSQH